MKYTGASYQLSIKELAYVLFGKKSCPVCGGKLIKNNACVTKKGKEINNGYDASFRSSANVKSVVVRYTCQNCNKTYPIDQLIN